MWKLNFWSKSIPFMKWSCNKNAIHVYKSYCFTKKVIWFALKQWMRLQQKKRVTDQWLCFSTNWIFHSSTFHTYILGVDTSISRSKTEHREGKTLYLCHIILVLHCCNWIAQIKQQMCPFKSENKKHQLQVWNSFERNVFCDEKSHWKLVCQS